MPEVEEVKCATVVYANPGDIWIHPCGHVYAFVEPVYLIEKRGFGGQGVHSKNCIHVHHPSCCTTFTTGASQFSRFYAGFLRGGV